MVNHQPSPPTEVKIDGHDEVADYATKSTDGTVKISAKLVDPDQDPVQLIVTFEIIDSDALGRPAIINRKPTSAFVKSGERAAVTLTGLRVNTRYRAYLTARDKPGLVSKPYTPGAGGQQVTFWTARPPTATPVAPGNNTQFLVTNSILLDWQFADPDGDSQMAYQIRWQEVAGVDSLGPWQLQPVVSTPKPHTTSTTTHMIPANTLNGNRSYNWQVRVRDEQKQWSDWSVTRDFYTRGLTSPPVLVRPIKGAAVDVSQPNTFVWDFKDPEHGDKQVRAEIRYRPVGGTDIAGLPISADWSPPVGPSNSNEYWTVPANTFLPGVPYEWQARTYDQGSGGATASAWSSSARFHAILTPGSSLEPVVTVDEDAPIQGALGCGQHRVFVYLQGGKIPVGEITPIQSLQWNRLRDDISGALLMTNGFGVDCGQMLANVHTWMHELVIFRDSQRVWEGPITRIADHTTHVEIEAKDVMAYLYRRILRQGYNDTTYKIGQGAVSKPGVPLGTQSVVNRAAQILTNALAYHDPNVLPYLTVFRNANDAGESRIVPDYSRTAWEEIDDLAANNGIDYVTVGRRIMIWDTHRTIGVLPEMRAEDFSSPPVLTEYGMQFANYYAITDNNGTWGAAYPHKHDEDDWFEIYGPIEMLASTYSGADGSGQAPTTNKARQELIEKFEKQAQRGIAHRWPAPVVVRVPDNSTLNPEINVGIQQLVPGVWIPLRFEGAVMTVAQWQKLDAVNVSETDAGEQIQVVMSPAPNGGDDDPDATATAEAV